MTKQEKRGKNLKRMLDLREGGMELFNPVYPLYQTIIVQHVNVEKTMSAPPTACVVGGMSGVKSISVSDCLR